MARQALSEREGRTARADDWFIAVAASCGARIVETFLTTDHIVRGVARKRELGARAEAVDMESFAILAMAAERGIPGLAVRVVGDEVDVELPLDFEPAIRPDGTISAMKLFTQAVAHPRDWPALLAFGQSQRRALDGLARFPGSLCRGFYEPLWPSVTRSGAHCVSSIATARRPASRHRGSHSPTAFSVSSRSAPSA